MIRPFLITALQDTMEQLETYGYPCSSWTSKELRRYAGIKYQFLRYCEKKRIIQQLPRNEKGRIIADPLTVYQALKDIRNYLTRLEIR
jgi:hypothetical protein